MPVLNYLWNPLNNNIVREFDDAGTIIAEYTTEADQFGNVVSQRRSGQDSVYHYDGQGSTLALTDANGNATDTYAYSAFGEVTSQTGSTVNSFRYIGEQQYYYDTETGEYDVRWRPYDAIRSRWMCVDPLIAGNELLGTTHRGFVSPYSYGLNAPLDYMDPSGLVAASTTVRPCTPAETASARAQCEAKYHKKYQPFLISGCLQATDIRWYLPIPIPQCVLPIPVPQGFITKTTTCCWGPCQFYERWCKWGVNLPRSDKGKRTGHWPIATLAECEACGDECALNKGDWKCRKGGGPRGPRWPTVSSPFFPKWPEEDGTNLEVLLCQGLAVFGPGGTIVLK
jgi:RHS repeat-associated protein